MIQDYQVATGDGGSRAGFEILPAKEGRIQAQFWWFNLTWNHWGGTNAVNRDCKGSVHGATAATIDSNNPIHAEMLALLQGIELWVKLQARQVVIEDDLKYIFDHLIGSKLDLLWDLKAICKKILEE